MILGQNEPCPFLIAASLVIGVLTGLSFLDEVAEIGSKLGRHLDDIDASAITKAGRGLDNIDEAAAAAKASRYGDDALDVAKLGRYGDELAEDATSSRLKNLDNFTGGNRASKQGDELRSSLAGSSDRGTLSHHLDNASTSRQGDVGANCRRNSFTAETLVHTDEGQKSIAEIKEGDKVLTEDPTTGEQGYFEVVAVTNHAEDEILRIIGDYPYL